MYLSIMPKSITDNDFKQIFTKYDITGKEYTQSLAIMICYHHAILSSACQMHYHLRTICSFHSEIKKCFD